jgi:hypothetical protein
VVKGGKHECAVYDTSALVITHIKSRLSENLQAGHLPSRFCAAPHSTVREVMGDLGDRDFGDELGSARTSTHFRAIASDFLSVLIVVRNGSYFSDCWDIWRVGSARGMDTNLSERRM